jgi:Large extracellular alpha-helical protein
MMHTFLRTSLVAALLVAAFAFVVPPTASAASGTVEPANGVAGTTFTFTVSGFTPGERLGVWLTDPIQEVIPLDKEQYFADENGNSSWQWTVPQNPERGNWRMTAQGTSSKLIVAMNFMVGLPPASSSVEPPQGGPGTTFHFTASGYTPRERTGVWLNSPTREVLELGQGRVDDNGVTTWDWTAPANAAGGTWRLVMQGNNSRAVNTIAFEVVAPAPTPRPQGAEPGQQGVSPERGLPGTTFTFFANGFQPREEVSYWATDPNGDVLVNNTKVRANKEGRIDWSWDAPNYPIYGTWTMTAFSRETRAYRKISFEIVQSPEAAAADALATVEPPAGPAGTTFLFRMGGFDPNGRLTYWVTAPDGSTSSSGKQFPSNEQGIAEFEWKSPENALEGTWTMVFFSFETTLTRRVNFVIGEGEPAPAPQVSLTVDPPSAPRGTTLTFVATGLTPGMLIEYFATDPNGGPEPLPPDEPEAYLPHRTINADANGRAEWTWTIPTNAMSGTWLMSIQRAMDDTSGGADVRTNVQFVVE